MISRLDVLAIRLIGEEVVRLLSLPDEKLEAQAAEGLELIAELASWRSIISTHNLSPYRLARRTSSSTST